MNTSPTIMSLETKDYVATDADVKALATSVFTAVQESDSGRKSYLRTLIATTQHTLGAEPRRRSGNGAKLDAEALQAQIKALLLVHDRFYAIVVQVAQEAIPAGTKDRGIEVNRRTNFARSALSAVRRYVRAGNDITAIAAKSATKASLAVSRRRAKRQSAPALANRAERASKQLVATLKQLASADREAALAELKQVMDRLSKQMVVLSPKPVRRSVRISDGHRESRATLN